MANAFLGSAGIEANTPHILHKMLFVSTFRRFLFRYVSQFHCSMKQTSDMPHPCIPHASSHSACQIPRECSVSPHYITLTTSVYDFPLNAALRQWHHLPEDSSIHTHTHSACTRFHTHKHTHTLLEQCLSLLVQEAPPALHIFDYLMHPFQDMKRLIVRCVWFFSRIILRWSENVDI